MDIKTANGSNRNNASKTAPDGVQRTISSSNDTNTLNDCKNAQNAKHPSLKPSDNIKFLEKQLGIDLGGWQSPIADATKPASTYEVTHAGVTTQCSDNKNGAARRTANAIGESKSVRDEQADKHKDEDKIGNRTSGNSPKYEKIDVLKNYSDYMTEIKSAVKNAPHNAKVRMRWIGIISVSAIAIAIGITTSVMNAKASSDRNAITEAIQSCADNGSVIPSVSGFAKYADENAIARGTELEIDEWRNESRNLDKNSIDIKASGDEQIVAYRIGGANVSVEINESTNNSGKEIKSVSIAIDNESDMSDGVKNGTPAETDGASWKKANLSKATNEDIKLIDGFAFHVPNGFAESYRNETDDGNDNINRKYAMDGNGEISVTTADADAHPASIQNQRQAEILRNAWNKTVAASAAAAGRQADSDTQFAGYTIDFGNGAFGYVSEYATSNQDGTAKRLDARILVTSGSRKATITYTRDGNSDAVPIDEIMKMIREDDGK